MAQRETFAFLHRQLPRCLSLEATELGSPERLGHGPHHRFSHGPPAPCWLALGLRVQPGTSLGSKGPPFSSTVGFAGPRGAGWLWAGPHGAPRRAGPAGTAHRLSLPHRHRLPPPPPLAFEGPQRTQAAFRGAQAGVPSPSPQLPGRGAGHAGCGMQGRRQGSREGPLPGAGARVRGQQPRWPTRQGRATAGQVCVCGRPAPRPPRFLLAHLCLLSLCHSLSSACFLHNRMADTVAAAGRLVAENTERP